MVQERDWKSEPISALRLSARCQRCVESHRRSTIGELIAMTEEEFLECRSFGYTTLLEVRARLADASLRAS